MSEELRKRIGDAYLNPTFVDGQVLLHTQLNEIVSVVKTGINENYYDIQRLINGDLSVNNSEKLNGALLSRYLDTTLQEDDNLVPSSQQVKAYVDKAIEDVQLGTDVGNLMEDINDIKTEVSANKGDIGDLQTSVSTNTTDIDNLEIEVDTLQDEVNDLKENPVGDALPYGTIFEYDGTEVPTGYEEVIEEEKEVVLFDAPSGYDGDITLNDNSINYKRIKVDAFHNVLGVNVQLPTYEAPTRTTYHFIGGVVGNTGYGEILLVTKGYVLENNLFKVNTYNGYNCFKLNVVNSNFTQDTEHQVYITKIVGYR